jgi:hypothetical protein
MGWSFGAIHKGFSRSRTEAGGRKTISHYPPGVQQAIDAIPQLDNAEPELVAAIQTRVAMFDRARTDMAYRGEEWEKCRKSPAYFISNWCWTYDPRRTPSNIPFNLFRRQEEYLEWLIDRIRGKEDGVVEKSRDMGLSWLCVGFAVHQFIFVPGAKITFGSRKEILVDRIGDPDSLFEKARMILAQLPLWMKPKRFSDGFLKFNNGDNGSTITGESGDNMGRGGRSRLYFLDEFAFVARAQKVDAAVSNNSDVKIYVSTPNGTGNAFAKKRFSKKFSIFTFNWRDDPRKGPAWYAKMKDTLDPIVLAQEIDIDYAASQEGVTIPAAWVMAAVELSLPAVGDRVVGLDIADEGGDLNVIIMRRGPVVRMEDIESWSLGNTTQTAYRARDWCTLRRTKRLNYDANGVGSGVSGTLKSAENIPFQLQPIYGSGTVSRDRFLPEFDREAKDTFKNPRAEIWWTLRRRFEKTYEHVNRIKEHPFDELISIPNHAQLIAELSQPLYKFTDTGLILIEGKKEMDKRGVSSPDFADALVYAFASGNADLDFTWLENA